ncbi:ABC transporter permease [Mycetocola reblochoni]|uniref:Dipeptide transport system permease protein DppB (TC 3.A.1.5.2) n=2 Tax=Mycetocola reblochoni TaxID=331618 RepID=A0A1R4JWX0_9MICO|nr:ABC transporter permease [Mycetocola reblochoni]RLP70617.1 ABC transporter permease [Mycetocola reblochoni]SJN36516.1 Dipeptide transport system permease protein DppB (TC 3.A.1.5.2) [Mycetocola reblochoni REB411]
MQKTAATRSPASPLAGFLLRRLGTSVLLLIGVTLVTFLLTNLVPGDPVTAALGEGPASDPATREAFIQAHGLDKPAPVQYVMYLGALLTGDLGRSLTTGQPVVADLAKAIPATIELAVAAIVLSLAVSLVLGTLAAYRRGMVTDQVLRVLTLIGLSVPTFWLALVAFYVFFLQLGVVPGSGRISPSITPPPTVTGLYTVDYLLNGDSVGFLDALAHLTLPVLVLSLFTIGLLTRFVRTSVLEVLDTDYVRAARAKGLGGWRVVSAYVLRGASLPILTVVGVAFGALLSGTVLVESVFSWPGLGSYSYNAARNLDLPGIMGVGLVVGVIYLVINLVVDLFYAILDPRVRLS